MDLTPYYMETYPTNISPCSLNPTNISSHSFAFCTDYLSLSPIEHHQQIDNMPLLLPVGDITDQIDDNHLQELIVEPPELLSNAFVGNFDCQTANGVLVDNAEQDLQVRSDQLGLLIDNVESPRIDEIHTVAQESPVDIRGSQNFQYNQTNRHFSSPLERDFESNLPNRSGAKSKRQIRWTPELHEGFVQAVKDLGGIDSATPKTIVTKMKVDGLRIDQVKSHLQKYREKCWRLDCEEDSRPSWSQGNKRISAEKGSGSSVRDAQETDMLRMQWELQKGIHEQLLIQRQLQELQVRAEENSRHLQGLMEDMKRFLASHSISSTSLAMAGLSSGPLYSLALRTTTEGTRLPCTQENVEKLSDNVVSDVDGDGSTL